MHRLAEFLIPYTFPLVSIEDEAEIIALKQRQLTIDGYDVSVALSKARYSENRSIESLQIYSSYCPFLPLNLVCKIGKLFLGENQLAYADFFKNGKKIYYWTVRYISGKKVPPTNYASDYEYEGFKYKILQSSPHNFYDC